MSEFEKIRRRAEIRRILFERMAARLMDFGIGSIRDLTDLDFEAVLAAVAAEMETEMQTFYAQRTADMLREIGVKPH